MSNIWSLLNEPSAFHRMHCLALIAYDAIYTYRDARIADTYRVLGEVEVFVSECLSNCSRAEELEAMVLQVLGQKYTQDYRLQVCSDMAQATVRAVMQAQLAGAAERASALAGEEGVADELRRLGQREGLRTVQHDADAPGASWTDTRGRGHT